MSAGFTPPEMHGEAPPRQRWISYVVLGLALILGIIIALVIHANRQEANAEEKANELAAAFEAAGLEPLDTRVATALFGTDGGIVCATADGSFVDTVGGNGASGPGLRPTDVRLARLEAARAVIEVYCPRNIDEFEAFVDRLNIQEGTTTTDTGSGG